jgi:hypothetical protein
VALPLIQRNSGESARLTLPKWLTMASGQRAAMVTFHRLARGMMASMWLVWVLSVTETAWTSLPKPAAAFTYDQVVRQFAYGRDLVRHCRSVIHDPRAEGGCQTRAVWWGPEGCCYKSVPDAVLQGAEYQMLAMEYETGNILKPAMLLLHIEEFFHGDVKAFCSFFSVDCSPVEAASAERKMELELLDERRRAASRGRKN